MTVTPLTFRIVGVLIEKYELTSEKNSKWRGYRGKVMGLGSTAEVVLTEEQSAGLGSGEMVEVNGRIEQSGSRTQLVATSIGEVTGAAGETARQSVTAGTGGKDGGKS